MHATVQPRHSRVLVIPRPIPDMRLAARRRRDLSRGEHLHIGIAPRIARVAVPMRHIDCILIFHHFLPLLLGPASPHEERGDCNAAQNERHCAYDCADDGGSGGGTAGAAAVGDLDLDEDSLRSIGRNRRRKRAARHSCTTRIHGQSQQRYCYDLEFRWKISAAKTESASQQHIMNVQLGNTSSFRSRRASGADNIRAKPAKSCSDACALTLVRDNTAVAGWRVGPKWLRTLAQLADTDTVTAAVLTLPGQRRQLVARRPDHPNNCIHFQVI